ncbi:hypothetical protein B0H13DRAFT_1855974 [Mycena leptocephala]|nr:hypothetical protein B0H13DRAFT_1855974 [Mycena leptocephala]
MHAIGFGASISMAQSAAIGANDGSQPPGRISGCRFSLASETNSKQFPLQKHPDSFALQFNHERNKLSIVEHPRAAGRNAHDKLVKAANDEYFDGISDEYFMGNTGGEVVCPTCIGRLLHPSVPTNLTEKWNPKLPVFMQRSPTFSSANDVFIPYIN